jgi:cystathionine gamma-synthase
MSIEVRDLPLIWIGREVLIYPARGNGMQSLVEGFSTQAVHAGEQRDTHYHSVTTPIVQASLYVFRDTADMVDYQEQMLTRGEADREEYGRYGNPTVQAVERKLAALEGGEAALLFATGMCAVTSTLLTLLSAGDHLILTSDCYRRTRQFCQTFLERWGMSTTLIPPGDYEAMEAAVQPSTRLIFSESPTNPYLRVLDLPRAVDIANRNNLILIVDSTFATPINQRPLELGVDLVIHSATKYLGGHNDLLAGAVVGPWELVAEIKKSRGVLGGITGPQDAYLLLRGLKTLALRVQQHNENGMRVAQFLEGHPKVRRVYYPGLSSHPDYAVAHEQMTGFGGVVSFEIEGDLESTGSFIDALRLPFIGPSLGGVESLVEQPAVQSYYELTTEQRQQIGISNELVRYALGIEDTDDLIADLEQALEKV